MSDHENDEWYRNEYDHKKSEGQVDLETKAEDYKTSVQCMYDHGKRATETLQVETQGYVVVCKPCSILLIAKNKDKRCMYCGVPIQNNWNKAALAGFHHQPSCPRNHEEDLIELRLEG